MGSDATDLAVGLARRSESFRATPYLDPVGIPTVGYGFTRYADGRLVSIRDPVMLLVPAEVLLRTLMAQTTVGVLQAVGVRAAAALTAGRLAAFSDFAYNLGLARFKGSTLCRLAQSGQWAACPAQFRKWRFAGGRILPGLVLRREAEIALFNQES